MGLRFCLEVTVHLVLGLSPTGEKFHVFRWVLFFYLISYELSHADSITETVIYPLRRLSITCGL